MVHSIAGILFSFLFSNMRKVLPFFLNLSKRLVQLYYPYIRSATVYDNYDWTCRPFTYSVIIVYVYPDCLILRLVS